ncbi:hypothetical protein PMZ80_006766 [Knufia obscura]|uniref:Uncharacterized protein n=1 Tax=Knufia obscura TaxID=1635080 RepID=A0ABR0RLL8_9EURO|nr:hypothetical protein PMZ80_006766 [Knufia obscura]
MSSQPNAPLTNPETASQQYRITRYGCRRCPEKDFKQKRKPRSGRDTSSVQYHVEHSHPDVDNWESLLFKWGYRIYDGKGGSTRVKLEETEEAANGADENDNRMDVDGEAGNHGEEVDNGDGDEENDETTMPTHSEHQTASTVGKGGVPPGPPQGIFHTKPPNKAPLP